MTAAEMMPGDTSEQTRPLPAGRERALETLRVLVVAGVGTGVLVAGVGSRLAMLLLRLTSPGYAIGVTSDDGFVIGRFTLGGSYNLLHLGAGVGVIGAGAYWLVAPWLLGPMWFRQLTLAAGSGAVVGSMLLHADGVDFNLLEPVWLAIGLFIALPALFGALLPAAVERVARPSSWTTRGPRRWALPLIAEAAFPFSIVPTVALAVVLAAGSLISHAYERQAGPRLQLATGLAIRTTWLALALAGLGALLNDIQHIA